LFPEQQYTRNNLGYCLYRQGKYEEAKAVFEECLAIGIDLQYVPNNYVRTLLAMGRNQDAAEFASGKYKISKSLLERIKKTDGKNHVDHIASVPEENAASDEKSEAEQARILVKYVASAEQFSSEKLLEDELTARIESGQPVFGLNLKVWKRKGEYGRQYILPTGKRLDLLCEDDNGDIYIIELKKDSGYDDAYQQTVEYVEWFSGNKNITAGKFTGSSA